jgi:hypothetical protein
MQHTATAITFLEKASAYKQIRSPFAIFCDTMECFVAVQLLAAQQLGASVQ